MDFLRVWISNASSLPCKIPQPLAAAMANQDIFSAILPADGISLPFFLEARTSERPQLSVSAISLTVRQTYSIAPV
jgi:hypothetical protein